MRNTLVAFHAHPDDEALSTGGVMAQAAQLGHRVVLVVATRGEHGEVAEGFLDDDEHLWQRRVDETCAAAEVLGVERVEFLGYVDSGMMGEPTNDHPGSFWTADVEEAAAKLAAILVEENATVLTVYDENGTYGHPDHIQVHRVGIRAAELAGTTRVYEATLNRDHIREMVERGRESGAFDGLTDEEPPDADSENLGVPASQITTAVDVRYLTATKREAVRAHRSQVPDEHFFLTMPIDVFTEMMGTEWFIRRDAAPGLTETSIWDGL